MILSVSLMFIGCSRKNYNFSDSAEIFKTREGKEIPFSTLSENTLVLIFSYECGYSLFNTKLFNGIKSNCKNKNVNFVAFTEISKDVSFAKYPQYQEYLKEDLEWDIIDNQRDFYVKNLLKEEIFPKLIYIKNGKRVLSIKGVPNDRDIEKINQIINES